jgi:periplasmic copper chaperone A
MSHRAIVDRVRRSRHTARMKIIRLAGLVLALSAGAALAHSFQLGAIEIGHPCAPPSAGGDAVVYLALGNQGSAPDRLVGAATPRAQSVELRSGDESPLSEIAVAPKRPIALRAGKPHLALHGVAPPLTAGESFPLTLRFAAAGTVEVTVTVEAAPGH